jgi:hypothetical protein
LGSLLGGRGSVVLLFAVLSYTLKLRLISRLLALVVLLSRHRLSSVHIEHELLLSLRGGASSTTNLLLLLAGCLSCQTGNISLGRLVSENLTHGNGATLVSQGESAHLNHVVVLLKANGDASSDSANDLGIAPGELWLLLLVDLALFGLLVSNKDLLYSCLLSDSVDVNDALVSL